MSLVISSYIHLAPGIIEDTVASLKKKNRGPYNHGKKSRNLHEAHHEDSNPNGK